MPRGPRAWVHEAGREKKSCANPKKCNSVPSVHELSPGSMASSMLLTDAWGDGDEARESGPATGAVSARVAEAPPPEEVADVGAVGDVDDDERRAVRDALAALRAEVAHRSTMTMAVAFACLAIVMAYVEGMQRELIRLRAETRRLR